MSFIIKGTAGCRYTENKGWQAYIPVEMNRKDCFLTLSEKEKAKPGYGKFSALDKDGEVFAVCDFRAGHKYMIVYRDLLQALEKGITKDISFESEKLNVPMMVTCTGLVPIPEKLTV